MKLFPIDGHHYYAMSFIEGDNLEDEIFYHKKTFNEKEALHILAQLLELVDYLTQKRYLPPRFTNSKSFAKK